MGHNALPWGLLHALCKEGITIFSCPAQRYRWHVGFISTLKTHSSTLCLVHVTHWSIWLCKCIWTWKIIIISWKYWLSIQVTSPKKSVMKVSINPLYAVLSFSQALDLTTSNIFPSKCVNQMHKKSWTQSHLWLNKITWTVNSWSYYLRTTFEAVQVFISKKIYTIRFAKECKVKAYILDIREFCFAGVV